LTIWVLTTDQLLTKSFALFRWLQKKLEYSETVLQLLIDFKKAYDSVRREALCNILMEYGVPM
jgi:hypothetical protein